MSIYAAYVYPDKLISPVNGYVCKRITKQNIRFFGFDSIEKLHEQYPNFPTKCSLYAEQVRRGAAQGTINFQIKAREQRLEDINLYALSPSLCEKCASPIPYKKRHLTTCSSSCANSRVMKEDTKQRISNSVAAYTKTICYISIVNCIVCNKVFIKSTHKDKRKVNKCDACYVPRSTTRNIKKYNPKPLKLCKLCQTNYVKVRKTYCNTCYPNMPLYRSRANFNFNVYNYPLEFDINLITKFGWYSTNGYKGRNKNPNFDGVSRDHLYSISDGFRNKINPLILGHPANCRIMKHNGKNGNNAKHNKSAITLEELCENIKLWNLKYPKPINKDSWITNLDSHPIILSLNELIL